MTAELSPERLAEIRTLAARVIALGRPAAESSQLHPGAQHRLLTDCAAALNELLGDRAALVEANAQSAAELAVWTGESYA